MILYLNHCTTEAQSYGHGRRYCVGPVLAESDERCHLAASMQPPIDDLPNLIIFHYMSMEFDANRRSITDRGYGTVL